LAAILAVSVGGVSLSLAEEEPPPAEDPAYESIRLLANAMQLIRQDYVDESRVDYEALIHSALRGMLAELDPHSQFLDPDAFRAMQEDTKSEFGGLGIQVGLRNGALVIVSPMEGTPAFAAGLLPGDRILKINGQTTDRLTLPEAVDLLRGEVGEKVTLTIQRPPARELQDVVLQRAIIKVRSVREVQLLPAPLQAGQKIGYIRLSQFSEPTAAELAEALDQLEAEGMQGLVLDLRFNPGGLLTSAIDVCAQFLPAGTEVVFTAGRTPGRAFATSGRNSRDRQFPMVILINSASASGAEIVAGALRDLGRAVLVGETTFGKGSVQGVSAMGDGSAIRLTTATYLTPSQQPIHEVGVKPHILSVLTPEQERALLRRRQLGERTGELPPELVGDSEPGAPALETPDPQLERAIQILRGVLLTQPPQPQA
jgi:carboxyl-terminal processing protease